MHNQSVDTEKSGGSRVLLAQHPRPSGHFRSRLALCHEEIMKKYENLNIKERLQNYSQRFNDLTLSMNDNSISKLIIVERYKELKNDINSEISLLKKLDLQEKQFHNIEAFYLPALREAHGEMKVKTNGPANKKMYDCLVSAQDYIDYYLGQLN